MTKTAYRKPLAELVKFDDSDIICTSKVDAMEDDLNDGFESWEKCTSAQVFITEGYECKLGGK